MRRTAMSTIIHHHGKPEVATTGQAKVGESVALSQLRKTVNKQLILPKNSLKPKTPNSAGVRKCSKLSSGFGLKRGKPAFVLGGIF